MRAKVVFLSAKGLRLGWMVALLVLLIAVGEVLLVDPLGILAERFGITQLRGDTPGDWTSALNELFKRTFRIVVVLCATYAVTRLMLRRPFKDLGFRWDTGSGRDVLIGMGMGFLIQIVSVAIMSACGWYSIAGLAWEFRSLDAIMIAGLYAVLIGVETAIIEEVLFRGFLIRACADRFDVRRAVILSSVLFGILHFGGFDTGFPWWASLLSATAAGFVFAQAFLVRGRLWIPFGMHFAWHFAARLLGSTGTGIDEAVCLVTHVEGPELLVSTRAGGAGGSEIVGVVLVSLLLWRMRPRHECS